LKEWDKEQGEHLKKLFKQYKPGKSIRAIASEAGVNHSNLSRTLRGELAPSENVLKRLTAIGIPVLPGLTGSLNDLAAPEIADLALLNFEQGNTCPAWRFTIRTMLKIYEESNKPQEAQSPFYMNFSQINTGCNYTKVTEAVTIFFTLGKIVSPAIVTGFMHSLLNFTKDQLHYWLTIEAGKDPTARRLLFHALLFALDPTAYVIDGGIIQIDQTIYLDKPDICIRTPDFGIQLVREFYKEQQSAKSVQDQINTSATSH